MNNLNLPGATANTGDTILQYPLTGVKSFNLNSASTTLLYNGSTTAVNTSMKSYYSSAFNLVYCACDTDVALTLRSCVLAILDPLRNHDEIEVIVDIHDPDHTPNNNEIRLAVKTQKRGILCDYSSKLPEAFSVDDVKTSGLALLYRFIDDLIVTAFQPGVVQSEPTENKVTSVLDKIVKVLKDEYGLKDKMDLPEWCVKTEDIREDIENAIKTVKGQI